MSKVYNKIVQSNTEPSKNDIWLKDGKMKTFGKEGWKPVGGGVSEGNNESVGDKEIYVLDATRTDYETLFNEVSEAWDSNKQIILNYMPEGYNVPIFDTLLTRNYKEEDSIVFGAGPVIMPHFYGNSCFMTPMLIINIFKDDIKINDTSISEFTEESSGYIQYTLDDKIYLSSHGDGTKFLSDDGSYKEIGDTNSSIFIDFSEEETIAAPDGLSSDITDNVYLRYYPDRYTGCIAKAISYIINDGYTQFTFRVDNYGGDGFKGFIRCWYDHSDNTISFTKYPDIDIKIIEEIYEGMISFEQRIAALEGTTA